nr:hypothetical protein [Tanacetum cinerariifolium]
MSLSQNTISSCYFRHVTMFFSVTNYSLDLAFKFLFSQLLADTMGEPIEGLADVGGNFPEICEDDLLDIIKDETSMPHMEKNNTTRVGDILLSLFDMRDERSIDEKSSWCKLREYDDESLDRMWKQDDDNGETKARTDKKGRKQRLWSHLVLDDERVTWYYWYFVSGRVSRTRSAIVSMRVSKCGVGKWVEMQKLFFEGSPRSSVDLKRAAKSAHGKVRVRWDSLHTSILKQTTPSGTTYLMMKESCSRYAAKVTEGHYYEYLIPLNEESLEMQKLFFEGSPRLSVDLKDKWRNLLASSCKSANGKVRSHGGFAVMSRWCCDGDGVTMGVSKRGVGKWVEMQKLFFEGSPWSSVDLKRAAKSAHGKVRGVSKCGVGKWVEMQKLFFEGSLRSSVDLKRAANQHMANDVTMVLRLSCGGDGVTMAIELHCLISDGVIVFGFLEEIRNLIF